jgi:signal peptidase I
VSRRTLVRLAVGTIALAVALTGWLLFAPTQLGGTTSYALIEGSSMEPLLERGDLVLLQEREGYRVGDVAAYHSDKLDRLVLHRIVGVEDGGFAFKGDANHFRDVETPAVDEIGGELWVTIPYAGSLLAWLATPTHAALAVGALTALLVPGGAGFGLRDSGRGRRGAGRGTTPWLSAESAGSGQRIAAVAAAALAVGALGLAFVSLGRPDSHVVTVPRLYDNRGSFSYDAAVPADGVYPTGRIETGDAVFLRLAHRLSVAFSYRVSGIDPSSVAGTAGFAARLSDGEGWSRDIVLQTPQPFAGGAATVAGVIDLQELRHEIGRFERLTGVDPAGYTLTLLPRVELESGARRAVFAPELRLRLDDSRLAPDSSGPAGGRPIFDVTEPVSGPRAVPGEIGILGRSLEVATARRMAAVLGIAAVLATLLAIALARASRRDGEAGLIAARHGGRLVPVDRLDLVDRRLVDVGTIDDLVTLAEHYGRPILYECRGDAHTYAVEEQGTVYRYRTAGGEELADLGIAASGARAR